MYSNIKPGDVLFLDIETVPNYSNFDFVPEREKEFWRHKSQFINRKQEKEETFYQRAGIYAEFGKIACISLGRISTFNRKEKIKLRSFYGWDEYVILENFLNHINAFHDNARTILCAHNGKEFDFPFLARRLLINGFKLPKVLDISGKKPWEVQHLDTMEMWKFGDYKHFTPLDVLAHIFQIPSPKKDMDGSMVSKVFYRDGDLERIKEYCEMDVLTIVQLFRRFRNEPLLDIPQHLNYERPAMRA